MCRRGDRALDEAITPLPPQTLAFLAERAADKMIRDKAAQALDSLDDLAGAWSTSRRRSTGIIVGSLVLTRMRLMSQVA